jgi:RND superfamily putative drug exporter
VGVVGGTTVTVDTLDTFADVLPWAALLIAITTFVLVFMFTGSLILPIKAIIMNVLSVGAALGILVLIFQDGRLEGLLNFTSQGALEASQPILIVAIAFGLSTDYGIMLMGRIREERQKGLSNRDSVAVGIQRTGRVVTAAALLLSIALGAFATSEIIFIKQIGVGAVAAVLIDATIVRALLVPSLMALLGSWNWWAPRWMRWLHDRIGVREVHGVELPAALEPPIHRPVREPSPVG